MFIEYKQFFDASALPAGVLHLPATRLQARLAPVAGQCWVAEEQALYIDVADVGLFTLMWTRSDVAAEAGYVALDGVLGDSVAPDALALCAGFLLTEALIENMSDIASLAICRNAVDVVKVKLCDPARVRTRRRGGLVASACGMCGDSDGADELFNALQPVPNRLRIASTAFPDLMADMQKRQTVFNLSGGTHAAALFDAGAQLLASAEDLGRHNALDKVIGQRLLRGMATRGCGALLSGRISLELVIKAARAGVELLAAVSAPSSLAIQAAEKYGITLCAFVRQDRLTVFTHPYRLVDVH